ncbi:MAG TPA: MFS transporter, partial [Ilumatobacteraceae bacterium]|nr:MFS transporter [Ilumatobacteraceae bacterium]
TAVVLPTSPRRSRAKVDVVGAVLLSAAVTCVVLFTTWGGTQYAWGSGTMIGLAVAAVVLLVALVVVERRVDEPIVPMHLFGLRTFKIASVVSFIAGVAMFGAISFLPLFLQVVNQASATNSGLLLLPLMLSILAESLVAGQVTSRTGHYKPFPIIGCGLATIAMYLLSTMHAGTAQSSVTVYMAILGAGIGFTLGTLILAVQNAVELHDLGSATSTVSFFRSTGGAIGVAMFGALFNNLLASRVGATIDIAEGSSFTPSSVAALPEAE